MKLKDFTEEELFLQGSAACAGCPGSMALRVAFKALGRNTLLVVIASCTSVLQSPLPLFRPGPAGTQHGLRLWRGGGLGSCRRRSTAW